MAVIDRCRAIAAFTDEAGGTTRTFLSPAMRECLDYFVSWAQRIGMRHIHVDAAGNFRALLPGISDRRIVIGSHLDSVPNAGAFDGVLGVVIGMEIAEWFQDDPPACGLEIVGFSEEEGVRFGRPFIGSTGFAHGLADEFLNLTDSAGLSVKHRLEEFGLNSREARRPQSERTDAFLEFHIEQGPLLESMGLPLGVVGAVAGQTRATVNFVGRANHAGTTPMNLRQDAFCAAAEWALYVEGRARHEAGLVATVGRVEVLPNAGNVVPGRAALSLDVRHAHDHARNIAVEDLLREARAIGVRRHVECEDQTRWDQKTISMDGVIVRAAERAVAAAGVQPFRMTSGAGHDAMILAERIPSAMIFLRSPGGVSHHPDENVLEEDVESALLAGRYFVENFV